MWRDAVANRHRVAGGWLGIDAPSRSEAPRRCSRLKPRPQPEVCSPPATSESRAGVEERFGRRGEPPVEGVWGYDEPSADAKNRQSAFACGATNGPARGAENRDNLGEVEGPSVGRSR